MFSWTSLSKIVLKKLDEYLDVSDKFEECEMNIFCNVKKIEMNVMDDYF